MSEPSNHWDAEEEPFTQEVFDIVNVVEAIDSCKSSCKLMSLTVQSLFLRASEIVSDHVLKMVDYLAFSETWELNEVTTEVPGFICIAKAKRPNARAAGVAVFQNSSATTTAVSHSIRKFCARNDVELDRSDEYGDICLAEITIMDKRALLFCLYISPDFTIKQKKFFLARNLFMYSEDDMPMVVTGNFNIDLSREENFQFVDFMRKYLRLELASDPTKATTRGGSCVDLTFIRNIRLDTSSTIHQQGKSSRESIRAERNSQQQSNIKPNGPFQGHRIISKELINNFTKHHQEQQQSGSSSYAGIVSEGTGVTVVAANGGAQVDNSQQETIEMREEEMPEASVAPTAAENNEKKTSAIDNHPLVQLAQGIADQWKKQTEAQKKKEEEEAKLKSPPRKKKNFSLYKK